MHKQKQNTLINFKKSHTSLSKIIKMLEEDKYCIDIMQQNLAVIGLLKSAHQMLMEDHFNSCFSHAIKSKNVKKEQEMVEEILKVLGGNVISVKTASIASSSSSIVYYDKSSYTSGKLQKLLGYDIEATDRIGIGDISIIIGKNGFKNLIFTQ